MSQLGSEKNEAQSRASDCKEQRDMLDQSNTDTSDDKRPQAESAINQSETDKVDELKKNVTVTASSEERPTPASKASTSNGSNPAQANKKVSQTSETDKRATDSDSVPNPNNGKTDNPLLAQRETPSSLSSANNNHTSSGGTNSFNGSRKPESAINDSRNHSFDHRRSNTENLSKTNLYIRGLPPNTTDDDLYTMCARFGDILSTKAILDKANGCCRGYGFVQYAAAQSAEVAVVELTKGGIQAQMARIPANNMSHSQRFSFHKGANNNSHYQSHYQNHGSQPGHHGGHHNSMNQAHNHNSHSNMNNNISDPTNLYLANLPLNMSEVELDTLLSNYGPVVSTRILRDERQNSRGVGFARMESRDKCQEIIDKLNGKSYKGSGELLLVKFADDGGRKRHNHSYNHQNNSNNHHHGHHQQHHHTSNNSHHKPSASEDDNNRWREGGDGTDPSANPSLYEHQRNLTHIDQMSDMSMMNHMSYARMQPTFPPAMATSAAYQAGLGPPTTQAQWIHPGAGQQWNVIPQHLVQPNNMNPSSQGAVAANYPYGHMSQLTSQMQGLHMGHPSGPPMGGYLPPQWSPVWAHPMSPPQQGQAQPMRMGAPATQAQQIPPTLSEPAPPFVGNQEGGPVNPPKHTRLSDTNKPIPAPL